MIALVLPIQAQLVFQFNYTDTNTGFNDPTLGATRRNALQSAASSLAGYFSTYNTTVTVTVSSVIENNLGLASASSNLVSGSAGFQRSQVQQQIITNSGSGTAAALEFNFGLPAWEYTGTWVSGNTYDFKSTAKHELLHSMGFFSQISSSGTGGNSATAGTPDAWTTYDRWITDAAGNSLVNTDTFSFETGYASALTGNPGMYFSGPNAISANGGNRVALYSPATWADGSSGSHLNDDTYPGSIMTSHSLLGQGAHALSAVEIGMLQDMGYSISAIPEPSTYTLIMAVVLLGVVATRRYGGRRPMKLAGKETL